MANYSTLPNTIKGNVESRNSYQNISVQEFAPYQDWQQQYLLYKPPHVKQKHFLTQDPHNPKHQNTQNLPHQKPLLFPYTPQYRPSQPQNLLQAVSFKYSSFSPLLHYNSFPSNVFVAKDLINPNPMPIQNQNGQYYHHAWENFQQQQQNPPNLLQNYHIVESKEIQGFKNDDIAIGVDDCITNELDSSCERTSDLGSSLNNSSSGESPEMLALSTKLISTRIYTAWEEDELTLLPGWKKRSYQNGIEKRKTLYQYMSPSLEIFVTRGKMVEHLKLKGHSKESIAKVEKGSHPRRYNNIKFKYTEWEEDELTLLPGWKKRSYQHGREKKKTLYQYMSPSLEIFKTRGQMVQYLKLNGYSEESVAKVEAGCRRNNNS